MKSLIIFALAAGSAARPSHVRRSLHSSLAPPNGSSSAGKVQYGGVNIAGFDFGCVIEGACDLTDTFDIASDGNGVEQMDHFVQDLGLNVFRLPVGWQFLVNDQLGGQLDDTNAASYDALVQGCLDSGSELCIIDIHNYARWDGGIVGQGGPEDDDLVSLWSQLAEKYADEGKVVFGVMNEPHDIPDIETWAETVQKVVTAIREAGATSQMILLPGNDFTSAANFVDNGSGAALMQVTNPDGSTDGLIFDVHKYLDEDNSGTHTDCVTNNIDEAFSPLADWLRENSRMAFLSESGGGNTDSCLQYMCEQLDFLNDNSDVYLGWTGWSAGGFDQEYELVETPVQNGDSWEDAPLMTQCVAGKFSS
ncbi:glycoside hydrolase superfamily [Lineolata rhizophorae]|uniref:Endoglucanase EG-II n=1 Tax=Lineolata rhizophorae TaxID=578093 RepID=A0A6A6NWW5_9PEZI|nr:glycoside hydrolase superfamily [Lineolata rhizophorae]